jgi:hypothetical protein
MIGGKLTEFLEVVTLVVNYSHVVTTPNYDLWNLIFTMSLIWFMPKGCLEATTGKKKKKKKKEEFFSKV